MKYSHVFLDFDETMFDHRAMTRWADSFFVRTYGTKAGEYLSSFDPHHEYLGEKMRLYHHEPHIKQVTGRDWSAVKKQLEKTIHDNGIDFCYPETHQTLAWLLEQPFELAILTFGKAEYQLYKINSCPYLRGLDIPVYVVDEHKREYLERQFKNVRRGVLVDDKHPLRLHKPWESIWIDRSNKLHEPQNVSERVTKISDLSQLKKLLI